MKKKKKCPDCKKQQKQQQGGESCRQGINRSDRNFHVISSLLLPDFA
jgi:hypothetical protein